MDSGLESTRFHNPHLLKRVLALVVSIFVGLASGTPYLYGIYSPQLIKRIGLTASDSANISIALNAGSGFGGLVGGVIIDHKGPRFLIFLGSLFIFLGYLGLYEIYLHAYRNLLIVCFCAIAVGFGSITSYFAALKASQANFPKHRGTAGVFPVSSYGLSASVFSVITAHFFEDNMGNLLRFLSFGCGLTAFVGAFFVNIYILERDEYEEAIEGSSESQPLLDSGDDSDTQSLAGSFSFWGIGNRTPRTSISSGSDVVAVLPPQSTPKRQVYTRNDSFSKASTSNSPSLSNAPSLENMKQIVIKNKVKKTPWVIIGDLLANKVFLTHYLLVALIAGVGQTYIYVIGFIVTAQVLVSKETSLSVSQIQAIQVGIISLCSFIGRLSSGIFSDFIHKKFHIQRLWIVLVVIGVLASGMLVTMFNDGNIHLITLSSVCVGGSYGLVFGVYPAVIADIFGTKTFSTTWGLICTGPILLIYFLNKYFGHIYDSNTDADTGLCYKGRFCYKGAIETCFSICFLMVIINLVLIYIHRKR